MSAARILGTAIPALLVTPVLLLAWGYVIRHLTACALADHLRRHADRMESLSPLRKEPPGVRHAADLIDPRSRRRRR